METTRNWALPGLLAAVQVMLLCIGDEAGLLDAPAPGPAGAVGVLVAVAVETVALSMRRRAPVRALVWVLATSVLGQAMEYDAYTDLGLPVALYSVAVRRPTAVTAGALAAAVGSSWLPAVVRVGFHPALATQLTVQAATYVVCVGLGLARRQRVAGRQSAARLLAGAEESRQRAGETERGRLARELHDVSAHHLTSVVVTVDVARRLGDRRPELVAEALEFAERTGRETLAAIQRLVAVMRDADPADAHPMTGRIQDLVSGFGRLGRPIAIDLPGDLAGPAAEAVHGIVREALTNALRHAPGSAVRVAVRRVDGTADGAAGGVADGTLELTVDNTAARGTADFGGLGSGRGVTGMRERAVALGGELTAGPGPDGGWRVRATLPDTTGPRQPGVRPRRRDFPREQRLADLALVFSAAVFPLIVLLADAEDWKHHDGTTVLRDIGVVAALLTLHALPLLWRRRAPWAVLAAVLASSWLWPVARTTAHLSGQVSPFLAGGLLAETLAVYALAAYGRGAASTWPAPLTAAGAGATALTVTATADGAMAGQTPSMLLVMVVVVPLGTLLCLLFLLVWGTGLIVRGRRLRAVARDDLALSVSRWEAQHAAGAERHLLAARLRDAVLDRTSALVELARRGELDAVATEARATLKAMRDLLHEMNGGLPAMNDGPPGMNGGLPGPARQQTPAPAFDLALALDALCRPMGPAGRKVTVRGLPGAAAGLPEPVALTSYRLVEAALGAGDRGPARVRLRRRRGALHLTVTGVRLAVHGPAADRLRAHATAAGACIALEPAGTVRVLLPSAAGPGASAAGPGPDPDPVPFQEVSPSPHV
ncbi:histidine kinase [Streptomyces dioscori]|uniref:histidine kinase n=1 Tax=Streptomyces dioscori TaxID=2109333 RepID=A0A2P8Q6L1_9ACTN|nr:histidine kinase [Streptomyces dioscori]PSM41886.1 histidine kinase [Streptomyces dioscori]